MLRVSSRWQTWSVCPIAFAQPFYDDLLTQMKILRLNFAMVTRIFFHRNSDTYIASNATKCITRHFPLLTLAGKKKWWMKKSAFPSRMLLSGFIVEKKIRQF